MESNSHGSDAFLGSHLEDASPFFHSCRPRIATRNMLRRIAASVPRRQSSWLRPSSLRGPFRTAAPTRLLSTTMARETYSLPPVLPPITTTLPSDSFHLVSDPAKSGLPEDALYEQQVRDVEAWWATPRYAGIKRPYTAADVVSKRGSLQQSYPSSLMARKLWNLVQERLATGEPIHTSKAPPPAHPLTSRHWIPDTRPHADNDLLPLQWAL